MGDRTAGTLRRAQGERKKNALGLGVSEQSMREKEALRLSLTKPIGSINAVRGEAAVEIAGASLRLRPSFAALVAAEAELGPLFGLVERAAAGGLGIGEMAGLFWHCLEPRPEGLTRAAFSEALAAGGLAAATPALKVLLTQILAGR